MTDQPIISVVTNITAVLDSTDVAINAEQIALQAEADSITAQIAALQAQLTAVQEQMSDNVMQLSYSARFRALATSIQDGSAAGSVVVPASPPPTGEPQPLTSGITVG